MAAGMEAATRNPAIGFLPKGAITASRSLSFITLDLSLREQPERASFKARGRIALVSMLT